MDTSRRSFLWDTRPSELAKTWTAFRAAGPGWPACRNDSRQDEGRWNRPGEATQYWALEEETAWCEMLRAESIRGEPELAGREWQIWSAEVIETEIADLSTWDRIEAAGLDPESVISADYRYCWLLRKELEDDGFRGAVVPSAAHHGDHANLILFGKRREVHVDLPGPNPRPEYFIEVKKHGDLSEPPIGLLGYARYKDDDFHRALEVWRASRAT